MNNKFERYSYQVMRCGANPVYVYGWGVYERGSVLEGQARKVFLDAYPSVEDALKQYPEAKPGSKWTDPQVSLNHLPDENDPVPGGMYPDDWTD